MAALPWLALTAFQCTLAQSHGALFLVLIPATLVGALYQWNLNGRLCLDRSVVHLAVDGNELQVLRKSGERYLVIVGPASRLYPRIAILKLMPIGNTQMPSTVVLWAIRRDVGNVPGDLHRQLRAWLRLVSSGSPAKRTL